jgi:F0F1-type ATP synthase membrane subunit b/b'
VEDVLAYVDQCTRGLREELNAKIEETQLELQTSLDMRTRSLREETAARKKGVHEEFQSDIETSRREFQTQLKEAEAWTARVAGEHSTTESRPRIFRENRNRRKDGAAA